MSNTLGSVQKELFHAPSSEDLVLLFMINGGTFLLKDPTFYPFSERYFSQVELPCTMNYPNTLKILRFFVVPPKGNKNKVAA